MGTVERINPDAETDASGRVNLSSDSHSVWQDFWKGRMEVIAITARERIYAQQPVHDITHRVTVRKCERTSQIRARDRVQVGNRTLNITGVIEVGSPARILELSCVEVAR